MPSVDVRRWRSCGTTIAVIILADARDRDVDHVPVVDQLLLRPPAGIGDADGVQPLFRE
jgi:hypothetical protein